MHLYDRYVEGMMRRSLVPVVILLLASCAGSSQQQTSAASMTVVETSSSGAGYSSMAGPAPVGAIPNAVLHDGQRNKDVEMVIEYPTRGGPHPIIIFSHGYGGSKNGYVALTEYWTSNGYVCIKPSHADAGKLAAAVEAIPPPAPSTGKSAGRADPQREKVQAVADAVVEAENVWRTQTEADWRNRVRDVTLIIDSLDALEEKYPELRGKMDHARIGVGGHSYGAFTTMQTAGMKIFQNGLPLKVGEGRVKAGVAMSPQGIGTVPGITADSWLDVKIPMLYMTGTLDRTADGEGFERRRDAFINSPAGDKFFILIEGARHMSFTGTFGITSDELRRSNTTGTLPPGTYPRDPRDPRDPYYDPAQQMQAPRRSNASDYLRERNIFNTVKVSTLAFWDAYLKSDAKGSEFLKGPGLRQRVGTTGSVETK
jgi:dienelactone hydrolase